MKINSINANLFCTPIKPQSFKHTAVPYPEYEKAYDEAVEKHINIFNAISDKISDLFHPEVSKQTREIKSQIDKIFDENEFKGKYINAVA